IILFFFFQAEDGIRDLYVTGVQTCALPIFNQVQLTVANAAKQGAPYSIWLFKNFFERKMGKAAFFSRFSIPIDGQWLALDRRTVDPGNGNAGAPERYHFSLFDHQHAARMFQNGGNIRGQVLLVLAQADDQWTAAMARPDK